MMPKNQKEAVLYHLKQFQTITSLEAIKEYGGDVNKIYQEFGSLSKGTKNVSALIYAHEMMLHS